MGLKKQLRIRSYRMSRAERSLLYQIESLVLKNIIGKAKKKQHLESTRTILLKLLRKQPALSFWISPM